MQTRLDDTSEGSLNAMKAALLREIGNVAFFETVHKLVTQLFAQKLVGYRLSNSNDTHHTYVWKEDCGCFQAKRCCNQKAIEPGLIFENKHPSGGNPADAVWLERAESSILRAITYHHLVMNYREQVLARSLLTQREEEVLRLIQKCLSNSEIAKELKISVRTVEKHCQNMFDKLQVENRNALIHLVATHEL